MSKSRPLLLFARALCAITLVVSSSVTNGNAVPHVQKFPCGMTIGDVEYDFSALYETSAPYKIVDDDETYLYLLNICGDLFPHKTSECTGSLCQYDAITNDFVSMDAQWRSTDGGPVWLNNNGVPTLQTQNGDKCFPNEHPRQVDISFVCDPINRVGDITIAEGACSYNISFSTNLACPKLPCASELGGRNYSFSSLTLKSGAYVVNSSQYTYEFNVCADVPGNSQCDGAICQYTMSSGYSFVSTESRWSSAGSGPQWMGDVDSFWLSTANGDICVPWGNARDAIILFVCDENHMVGTLSVDDPPGCVTTITFPTKLACTQ